MYDFCFTFPYSALLALGGLIGFVSKGSVPSLIGGLGSAGVLAACGYASLANFRQGKLCRYYKATGICWLIQCSVALNESASAYI